MNSCPSLSIYEKKKFPDNEKCTKSGPDLRNASKYLSVFTDFLLSTCGFSFTSETNIFFNGLLLDTALSGFSCLLVWFSQSDASELPIESSDSLNDGSYELMIMTNTKTVSCQFFKALSLYFANIT